MNTLGRPYRIVMEEQSSTKKVGVKKLLLEVSQLMNHGSKYIFLQPLRLLHQLSGFPSLSTVLKTLATVAVSLTTAEQTMSKVWLIKTRLQSAMTD
jgi:hypothetical protein